MLLRGARIAFYDSPAFNNSPAGRAGPIDMTADEIDNIGRFLRVLNATFNIAVASTRFEAAGAMLKILGGQDSPPRPSCSGSPRSRSMTRCGC